MRARGALRGNLSVMLYALAVPSIIAYVLQYLITHMVPGVKNTLDMVTQGNFETVWEQRLYVLNAMVLSMSVILIIGALLSFFTVGQKMTALAALKTKVPNYKILFSFFPHWFSAFVASIAVSVLPQAVATGSMVLSMSKMMEAFTGNIQLEEYCAVSVISLCACAAAVFLALKFYFVFFTMAEDGADRPFHAIAASWRMTGLKTCGNIIVLELSFIGWHILASLTMGISLIYSGPYMLLSQAELYDRVRDELQKLR